MVSIIERFHCTYRTSLSSPLSLSMVSIIERFHCIYSLYLHTTVPSYPFTHITTPRPLPPIFLQYMVQVLHAGDNMEFFIEGSRSRSGKPGMPKAGLLSVLVDSVKEGT